MLILCIVFGIIVLFLIAVYIVYRICFLEYRLKKTEVTIEDYMPTGKDYEKHQEVIRRGIDRVMQESFEQVFITSEDGLKLSGRYYHRRDNAPIILMMHGYHGNIFRDGNGIFYYSGLYGFNILMADQRAQNQSEGKTITFGIKERYDCKCWAKYLIERFGEDIEILLCGLSMGAATVMMAADVGLPKNVKGIMADCGYSSPKEILVSVMKSMKLPTGITYPLAKLAAGIFGHFNLEESSAVESMKHCKIPVLLIHGEADDFVPCYMSVACKEACVSEVELVTVADAGHGMSYCLDAKAYEDAVGRFFKKTLKESSFLS